MWPQERLSPGEMYQRGAEMTAVLESAAQSFVEHPATGPAGTGVCAVEDLELAWGEAALIAGRQVALFRTAAGEVFAVAQEDPATGAHVMARGILGSRGTRPTIASPLHKEVYDLETGECLGTPELRLPTFGTRIVDGYIEVELLAADPGRLQPQRLADVRQHGVEGGPCRLPGLGQFGG